MAKKKSKKVELRAEKNIRRGVVSEERIYAGQTFETDPKTARKLEQATLATPVK